MITNTTDDIVARYFACGGFAPNDLWGDLTPDEITQKEKIESEPITTENFTTDPHERIQKIFVAHNYQKYTDYLRGKIK